jgi:hypothetical protein
MPTEGTYQGAAFGALSTGLRRAARGLRHHPFAPNRSRQNATAGGTGVPGVQDGGGHQPLPMGSSLSSSSLRGPVPRLPRRYRYALQGRQVATQMLHL